MTRDASRKLVPIAAILSVMPVGLRQSAMSQPPASQDAVERSMAFIEGSADATELLSAGKSEQALAAFRELMTKYADLDTDGYVAASLGDCLAALARSDEARSAYEQALAGHPELAESLRRKIVELELDGEPGDALIDRLRQEASGVGSGRVMAQWQLARALEKRTRSLLVEAVAVLKIVAGSDSVAAATMAKERADALDELAEELGAVVAKMDKVWNGLRWGAMRIPAELERKSSAGSVRKIKAGWVTQRPDGAEVKIECQSEEQDCQPRFAVGGKPLVLSDKQLQQIRRHQDRINAIVLEAAAQAEQNRGR